MVHVQVVPGVDLSLERFEAPSSGVSGDNFRLVLENENKGSKAITASWVERVWLSADGILDASDTKSATRQWPTF